MVQLTLPTERLLGGGCLDLEVHSVKFCAVFLAPNVLFLPSQSPTQTFTGNFVYYIQSVLPEGILERLLGEMGYVATTATEFSLVRKLNEAEAEQVAFDLFLARIECEDIFEMAKDMRNVDLGEMLQKHWPPEDTLAQKHQASQIKEYGITGKSKTQECCGPQQATPAKGKLAFDDAENGRLSLRFTEDESQPPVPEFTSELNLNQSHGSASENCVKSTDSEDFLVKYSDIVIGQKPLHLADLSPKEKKTQPPGLLCAMLGATPADGKQPPTVPSPGASGPQAMAILNNATLERGVGFSCRNQLLQGSSQEVTELSIRDAIKCLSIHRSDSTDEPKELKGDALKHSNQIISTCLISREEENCDLSSASAKLKTMEDSMEGLVYPIEETEQPEFSRSKIGFQKFSHSRMKLEDPPGRSKGSNSVDLYSSNQFCNITGYEHPSVHSGYDQHLVDIPSAHGAGEGFKDVRRPSSSTINIPPDIQCGGPLVENRHRGCPAGCSLYSSFPGEDAHFDTCIVRMNDADTEGFVVITKDQ